eukprot:3882121-Rhodomonas_salina.1
MEVLHRLRQPRHHQHVAPLLRQRLQLRHELLLARARVAAACLLAPSPNRQALVVLRVLDHSRVRCALCHSQPL